MHLLALADDLTGALEAGAKFAGCGLSALVTTGARLDPAGMSGAVQVLVIDTETRHRQPEEAASVVRALACSARDHGIRFLYKKTDSTLRGNIGAELGALRAAWPDSPLVYVPAYPQLGRTVRQGHLCVNGIPVNETAFAADALNPVRESHIPTLLAGCGADGIEVCDGESDADVEAAARRLLASAGPHLAAGPAAIAEQIARLLPLPRSKPAPWPAIRRCLVVNGSRHEVSARQVEYAESNGWRSVDPQDVPTTLERERWLILKARDGAAVRNLLAQADIDALVVFGGDTAYEILTAAGLMPLHPLGEVLPGVPVSRAGALHLITKAGGFGSENVLCALRNLLDPVKKEQ